MDKILRSSRKRTDQFIISGILSFGLFLGGSIISAVFLKLINPEAILHKYLGSDNLVTFFIDYLLFFGIWIMAIIFIAIPKYNRPMLNAWGYNREGNNIKGIIAGALLGFGTNGFCVLMSVLMGDIKLSYTGFRPGVLLGFLAVILIQSGAEEITDRLYLYQKLRRRYRSPLVAIILNAAIFMSLHIGNDGFTVQAGCEILLVGIIFSVIVYYYNSLWAAIWFHTLWNYTQNIIFGLPNSGVVSEYSIFKLEAVSARSGLFYDVVFGVEGSIGSLIVLAILLVVIVVINRGKPEKHDYWAEAEAEAAYEAKH